MLKRRKFLEALALGATTLTGGLRWPQQATAQSATAAVPTGNRLTIPPLQEGIDDGTEKRFELRLQHG